MSDRLGRRLPNQACPSISWTYGHEGSVTIAGIHGAKAIDLLYRLVPEKLGIGSFDLAVVDTPPEVQGGSLPGEFLMNSCCRSS
jgi:hypothetical protein